VREIAGVLFILAGLLGGLAVASHAGSILAGLQGWLVSSFGRAWFVPVAAVIALGAYMLWPRAPRPRVLDVLAGTIAVIALVGLFGLAAQAGGSAGRAIDDVMVGLAGTWGAWALLVAGLVIGLIVTIHFSPGALIATVVKTMQAAFAERRRLERLVAAPTDQTKGAVKTTPVAAADDVGPAYPPVAAALRSWEVETENETARVPESKHVDEEEDEPSAEKPAALRVVAEPEDDLPEIDWKLPSIALLDTVTAKRERMADEIKRNVKIIEATLETFGVSCKVVGVNPGPAVTQYELQPGPGVQVKRITALQNDLSLALAAAPLRIEAPIPGKAAVGIEVPNKSMSLVTIREVLETAAFREGTHTLALALGNDVSGQSIVGDLTRMPHLLIAGATGQGKSVCINALITSLLFQVTPDHLRLLLIDPKRVELTNYNGLPHLALPVLVESHQAAAALRWAVAEMDRRYKMFSAEGVRNIAAYNEKATQRLARQLPYIVIVIDELADLMMVAAGEIEELICRIAQLARAVGIHLVIATQRPSTDMHHRSHQGQYPVSHRVRGRLAGRQPRDPRYRRRREAARPRRHAVSAGRRRQADPHPGRIRQRPGGRVGRQLLAFAGRAPLHGGNPRRGRRQGLGARRDPRAQAGSSVRASRARGRRRGRGFGVARAAQVQRRLLACGPDRRSARRASRDRRLPGIQVA